MIDADALLADTKKQVVSLVDDLRAVAATDPEAADHVASEYNKAHAAGRTAFGQAEWAEGLYAQVAVAWVLGCVFVRFCEDNDLIDDPLLGGPGIRGQLALDHRAAHLQANPSHDDRQWIREVFGHLRSLPATGEIFGAHNPVWVDGLVPSADGTRRLREELTRVDPETGELRHDFTDAAWDTRFLGDLYQDLSEHAKKTFALLQTPVFVEEFILDRTLEPAIATFGLADTTVIDPTCGSGHFLLGAFARLFEHWCEVEPTTNRRELARRSLGAIGGIDLNPFAASVARFRLMVAALRAGGDRRLADAPAYKIRIAVGDSLLHGDPPGQLPGMHTPGEEEVLVSNHGYEAEDVEEVRVLLARGWTSVVGNPPYIAVKDPALRAAYKARFDSCHGRWTLGLPFIERFWQLAVASSDPEQVGYVGLITDNSFMKREKGKKLVEDWVPTHDITHVLDTSGVPIPGHGTGSVILFGRNRVPRTKVVRALLKRTDDPSHTGGELSPSWQALIGQVDDPGSESVYFSSVDLDRDQLRRHPWSIGGGGAAALKERLDQAGVRTVGQVADAVGITAVTGEDELFILGTAATAARLKVQPTRSLVVGDVVRDWKISEPPQAIWTYDADFDPSLAIGQEKLFWMFRSAISRRKRFGTPMVERGLHWWEWQELYVEKLQTPLSIVFASVSTGNHFVLDRGSRVFKQSSPVIKLPASSKEETHAELLGVLNSSSGCFWLKQVSHSKGGDGVGRGIQDEAWETRYDFDSTKVKQFPLPRTLPLSISDRLNSLASELLASSPASIADREVPTADVLAKSSSKNERIWQEMIAAQERLDWECYQSFGLVEEELTTGDEPEPPLKLGERAFEIVLARALAAGERSSWFTRHRSVPITELPRHWSPRYRDLVLRRIALIESDLNIGLIERPEYKRRWASQPWDRQVQAALSSWLLDRLEDGNRWPEPAALTTVARLTAEVRSDEEFVSVARLFAGREDVDLGALIAGLVNSQSIAYLAAFRYSESGLRTHVEWLETWETQRREDHGEEVGLISVPPKYVKSDYTGVGWEHRGKLDVPKERFISYPGAERETDASTVIGWAGWDHLDRARALAAWYLQARRDGRDAAHLTPLLAGLTELVPWLKQWYDEPSPDPALDRPGTQIAALVETELRSLSLTAEDLVAWRPEKKKTVRKRKATQ